MGFIWRNRAMIDNRDSPLLLARVIYYHVNSQHIILLIVAYAKNEQEDLGRRQLQIFANHVKSEFP